MTDYTKACSDGSTMMIRDTGSSIELWVRARDTYTYVQGADYSWTVNGSRGSGQYNYSAGMAWQRLKTITSVFSAQTVNFTIGSGVTVLGGVTSFSVTITRGEVTGVPLAPTAVQFSLNTGTSVATTFGSRGDGGSAITAWQLGYGTNPSTPTIVMNVPDGTNTLSGLVPGRLYYFWARGHNANGWGPWSPRTQVTMLRIPEAPNPVFISSITQTSMSAHFTGNGTGGSPIVRWELGYGTNTNSPQTIVASSGTTIVTGLGPGTTYYFWARGVNAVGAGPWSPVRSAKTISGININVNGKWRTAIPYVNVGGVWKVARPWSRHVGVWKETG